MENLAKMKLHDIDQRAMANSKYIGAFVGNSYQEGLTTCLLGSEQAKWVRRTAEKLLKQTGSYELYQSTEGADVVKLRHPQIELGDFLGKGSFSNVYAIKSFRKLPPGLKLNSEKYVVKLLQPKFAMRPQELAKRAADLAKDGLILASLNHKHILKVKGWTPTLLAGFETAGRHDSFFLVLEKLQTSLDKRMEEWKKKSKNLKFAVFQRESKKSDFWIERMKVALQLCEALKYLHDNRILHRDLKPDNVGFDSSNILKLYDFDMARVMPDIALVDENATFRFTQNVGSLRYMSPECGLGHEYNRMADVYSFSLLLWELLSLDKPYQNVKSYDHKHEVFLAGVRPEIPEKEWPASVCRLLEKGWKPEPTERPDMQYCYEEIICYITSPESPSSESAKDKNGWGWPLVGKDAIIPKSPGADSFSVKMGHSTPRLLRKKLIPQKSLSNLDL